MDYMELMTMAQHGSRLMKLPRGQNAFSHLDPVLVISCHVQTLTRADSEKETSVAPKLQDFSKILQMSWAPVIL